MFIAVGRKTGIKLRRSGTPHVAPTELFEIFQCICYKRFAPMGLVFVGANLMPNTVDWQPVLPRKHAAGVA